MSDEDSERQAISILQGLDHQQAFQTSKRAASPSPSQSYNDRQTKIARSSRGRTGCLNCRRRRKKCDEAKPQCVRCQSHGEVCEPDREVVFRLMGLGSDHPSMKRPTTTRSQSPQAFTVSDSLPTVPNPYSIIFY